MKLLLLILLMGTKIDSSSIEDSIGVTRQDLDVTNSSKAVIAKAVAGRGLGISSTGPDAGTGDVTFNVGTVATNAPSANQNDLSFTGSDKASYLRIAPSNCIVITGLADGVDGRVVTLMNGASERTMVLAHLNASSTAANRFDLSLMGVGKHWFLMPGDVVNLVYDGTDSRWKVISSRCIHEEQWRGIVRAAYTLSGTTVTNGFGLSGTSNGGTISHQAIATTNYQTSRYRMRCATGTTGGTNSGVRYNGVPCAWRGSASGFGGFVFECEWTVPLSRSTNGNFIVGLTTGGDIAQAWDNPSHGSAAAFVCGNGHSNWRVMASDGSSTATSTDLGANFPINTTAVFKGFLASIPNGGGILYCIWRMDDLTVAPAVGILTSDLPVATAGGIMSPYIHVHNGGDATDNQIEWYKCQLYTP